MHALDFHASKGRSHPEFRLVPTPVIFVGGGNTLCLHNHTTMPTLCTVCRVYMCVYMYVLVLYSLNSFRGVEGWMARMLGAVAYMAGGYILET